jgi:hypothetical protein
MFRGPVSVTLSDSNLALFANVHFRGVEDSSSLYQSVSWPMGQLDSDYLRDCESAKATIASGNIRLGADMQPDGDLPRLQPRLSP